jgi:hypothetical protein
MSKQTERKFILNMLETGTIDTDQAQSLLHAISPNHKKTNRTAPNTIVLEMDADEDNLRSVLDKFNKAIFG